MDFLVFIILVVWVGASLLFAYLAQELGLPCARTRATFLDVSSYRDFWNPYLVTFSHSDYLRVKEFSK
jgi:hypothetical protein